jgi:hypothetical protein
LLQQLEEDLVRAAEAGVAAQAVRMEQRLEDEILATAVKKLGAHRRDKAKQAEDMRQLQELVRRDKRAVEVLSSVLGSSSGVSMRTFCTELASAHCTIPTMALGSAQPLIEMNDTDSPARKADNLTAICTLIV